VVVAQGIRLTTKVPALFGQQVDQDSGLPFPTPLWQSRFFCTTFFHRFANEVLLAFKTERPAGNVCRRVDPDHVAGAVDQQHAWVRHSANRSNIAVRRADLHARPHRLANDVRFDIPPRQFSADFIRAACRTG